MTKNAGNPGRNRQPGHAAPGQSLATTPHTGKPQPSPDGRMTARQNPKRSTAGGGAGGSATAPPSPWTNRIAGIAAGEDRAESNRP